MACALRCIAFMKTKTIKIEHPLASVTVVPHRPLPFRVYQKIKKSIEGLLNATQDLLDDWDDESE